MPKPIDPNIREKLIIALDMDGDAATRLVKLLLPYVKNFKVGLKLFTQRGPEIVKSLKGQGAEIFLDLKLHDIPQTVRLASREASKLGAFMLTVHVSGGGEMMRGALEGAGEGGGNPLVVGVTLLTSLDASFLSAMGIPKSVDKFVEEMALAAKNAGLPGVVSSVGEVKRIKESCGTSFLTVTPGIRFKKESQDDQKRISTPQDALEAGADFLVIGRPITHAPDPVSTLKEIIGE